MAVRGAGRPTPGFTCAASTQNQARSALLFLYREVLLQPLSEDLTITDAKRRSYLPTVLSREEACAMRSLCALQSVSTTMVSSRAGLLYGPRCFLPGVVLCLI
jgi:hypothetical protein